MKRVRCFALVLAVLLFLPLSLFARDLSPIVSTDWLEKNLTNPKLKIVDIRKLEEYKDGHIPGALSAFYGTWAIKKNDLQNELPPNDDLADLVTSLGIAGDSLVVVAGKADNPSELVNITRVAWTLRYAGLENIAVLDGAFNKWMSEKKPVSKDMVKAMPSSYKPKWNMGILASREYVMKMLKKATLVDARMPEFFFGVAKLDFVKKAGHIPGATDLPSGWIFTKEGTFKTKQDLADMAGGVLGKGTSKEIIVYCDTGKVCSGWWFTLSEVLGYENVKNYDGSMEDWTKDPQAPVVKYSW
jgi:thiosulfate/3-mercaptopyruvate sulfurtransferase